MTHISLVPTSVAQIMMKRIAWAKERGSCIVFAGESGLGKTSVARHMIEADPDFFYLECCQRRHAKLLHLLREIAEFFLPYNDRTTPSYEMLRDLDRLTLNGAVLFLDEAQNLGQSFLREIQGIGERTGLAVIFCGNHQVLQKTYARKGPLSQISGRVALFEQFECLTDDDADAIASTFGVQAEESLRLLRKVAADERGWGLMRVLESARRGRFGTDRTKAYPESNHPSQPRKSEMSDKSRFEIENACDFSALSADERLAALRIWANVVPELIQQAMALGDAYNKAVAEALAALSAAKARTANSLAQNDPAAFEASLEALFNSVATLISAIQLEGGAHFNRVMHLTFAVGRLMRECGVEPSNSSPSTLQ